MHEHERAARAPVIRGGFHQFCCRDGAEIWPLMGQVIIYVIDQML